jgi:hypothetical protein
MAEFDFNQLMADPLFGMGVGLLSQSRTYGRPASLAEAMRTGFGVQQSAQSAIGNQLNLQELQRKRKAQADLADAIQAGDMKKVNQIRTELDPTGTLADMMKQAETQKQQQALEQWRQNMPPGISPEAQYMLGAPPEILGKIGPGVLPGLMRPQEKKSPTSVQEYEFAKQQGFGGSYLDFVKAMKEKPIQVSVGGKPQYDVALQEAIAEAKARGTARGKTTGVMRGLDTEYQKASDLLSGIERDEAGNIKKTDAALPTGSGIGAGVDWLSAQAGISSKSADKAQALKVIGGALVTKVPRFEGPQSDKDTALYKEMAGQVGDSTIPIARRKAALETMYEIYSNYASGNAGRIGSGTQQSVTGNIRTQKSNNVLDAADAILRGR